ncbi:MAG: NAD-dependent epimerase/dehydratase family protein [Acidimicrobiales bacterium]
MTRIAILGASGFLGSAVSDWAGRLGADAEPLRAPRLGPSSVHPIVEASDRWCRAEPAAFAELSRRLAPFDTVVNASGIADPGSTDRAGLFAADAIQPVVVARAAAAAGVRRLVHVSTAAVQGRREPLDETPAWSPLSPYAEAKAEAERLLLVDHHGRLPPEVVVYRPTSVHGAGRAVTANLARLAAGLPVVAVCGSGAHPVPVALVDNVAAGIVFAATAPALPRLVLQPWEGLTARRLLELFGATRFLRLPEAVARPAIGVAARCVRCSPPASARLRRLELVLRGQAVRAGHLADLGFRPPVGFEGWERLADEERRRRRGTPRFASHVTARLST